MTKTHRGKSCLHKPPALRAGHGAAGQGKFDVFIYSGVRENIVALQDKAHMVAAKHGGFVRREGQHIRVEHAQAAAVRRVQQAQQMQQGGLAAARRAHDGHKFPWRHGQIHAFEHLAHAGIGFFELSGCDDMLHSCSPSFKAQGIHYIHFAGAGRGVQAAGNAQAGRKQQACR